MDKKYTFLPHSYSISREKQDAISLSLSGYILHHPHDSQTIFSIISGLEKGELEIIIQPKTKEVTS